MSCDQIKIVVNDRVQYNSFEAAKKVFQIGNEFRALEVATLNVVIHTWQSIPAREVLKSAQKFSR